MPEPEDIILDISPYYKKKGEPSQSYSLVYNSTSETLEPIYFWILDFMGGPDKVDKIVDTFTSSPGSGHFSELMGKATRMQDEAMKIYGTVNTVLKSILNLVYDLKEFQLTLEPYKQAKSKDKETAMAGLLALKQRWMDQVDVKKGAGSINMMAQQLNFITLRDAFMAANKLSDIESIDLNERVKRILKARLSEFFEWKDRSEIELKKRFEIEKTYLKTQVNTVKLYSRWARPYLRAAEELSMAESKSATLVKAFNTITMELTLFKKSKLDVEQAAVDHDISKDILKAKYRNMYSCSLVRFVFRGIPQKAGQHYVFGGKADVTFKAFALNQDELDLFYHKLDDSDLNVALNLIDGATKDSLGELKEDIDYYLDEGKKQLEKEKAEQETSDVNPFAALLGLKKRKPKTKQEVKSEKEKAAEKKLKRAKELEAKGIKPDSYVEKVLRSLAEAGAKNGTFKIYDIYKKGHGMASHPAEDFLPEPV